MSNKHNNHHYVPKFLLKSWEHGEDKKLFQTHWVTSNKLFFDRYKAKSVGFQNQLYSMYSVSKEARNQVETEVMSKYIDNDASLVYNNIINRGFNGLSDEDRYTWNKFLIYLIYRGPDKIDLIKELGLNAIASQFPKDFNRATESNEDLKVLYDLYQKRDPGLLDFALYALSDVMNDLSCNKIIYESKWILRKISCSDAPSLLIGDKPILLIGSIDEYYIGVLPMSPKSAFIFSNSTSLIEEWVSKKDRLFVRDLNKMTVEGANEYIWSISHYEHEKLIKRRLQNSFKINQSIIDKGQ